MKPFLGFALLMIVVAVATVLWPLLRGRQRPWVAVAIAGIGIPVLSGLLYTTLSNWPWDGAQSTTNPVPALEQSVRNLELRLQGNPADVSGWLMLGRSQFQLNRFPEAAEAFRKAYTLTQGRDVDAVLGLGESLAFSEESALLGQSAVLFDQAYSLAPDHPKALWYTGLVAYQSGRLDVARDRWARLIAQDPPPQVKRLLQDRVIEIEAQLVRAGEASPAKAAPALVKVRVSIAADLAAGLSPDTPLFVMVRAGEGGPPLAVTRRSAGELPALIELSDQDVMIRGRDLSAAGKVTVLARVARSGQPVARSGDLEGRVSYDVGNPAAVDLVIDSVVP